jgi:hypothetical protein
MTRKFYKAEYTCCIFEEKKKENLKMEFHNIGQSLKVFYDYF